MINKISFAILTLAVLFIAGVFLLYYFPVTVIKANRQPYRVITKEVKQGGDFIYEVDACKYMQLTATINRSFVDGIIYNVPLSSNDLPTGCNKSRVLISVPKTLPLGKYHLELNIKYKVNPVREVFYHFTTEEFQVIK